MYFSIAWASIAYIAVVLSAFLHLAGSLQLPLQAAYQKSRHQERVKREINE